jgi:hypothetical protein
MKSRSLNRSSKLKIYKSLIRPVVTYGFEAWTITNRDEVVKNADIVRFIKSRRMAGLGHVMRTDEHLREY